MDILEFFDRVHPEPSWKAWRTFVKCVYGYALDTDELLIFRKHTGRDGPRASGYPEAAAIVGVQSGKSRICGTLAAAEGLRGDRGTTALLIAQDSRSSVRTLFRYAKEPFDVPALRKQVVGETADYLELKGARLIAAYPSRPQAARGVRASVVILDELCFFTNSDGRANDTEVLRVARGRVATTRGKVIMISSPYAPSGAMYELYSKHFGNEDSSVLIWQADAPSMNPTLAADYVERMKDDPEAYESEVLGLFRRGLSMLFEEGALEAVTPRDVREVMPAGGRVYVAGADAAGGKGADSFAVAVASPLGDGAAALVAVRAWAPDFSTEVVVKEVADFLRTYGLTTVHADKWGGGLQDDLWQRYGIKRLDPPGNKSDIFLQLLPLVNSGKVSLLDDPALIREARGMERRTSPSGRDRVDHRRGGHDDRVNAAAIALVICAVRSGCQVVWVDGERVMHGLDKFGRERRMGRPWNGRFPEDATRDGKGRLVEPIWLWVDGVRQPYVKGRDDAETAEELARPKARSAMAKVNWG